MVWIRALVISLFLTRRASPFSIQTKATTTATAATNGSTAARALAVDLATQLEYARNGHSVLRNAIDPVLLRSLRKKLWKHGQQQALDAWRQKVEVASDSAQLAAGCTSVEQCQQQLLALGVPPDSVPFLQYFHCWRTIPAAYQLACQLAETAATLMDVSSLRLYQDSLFWKRPGDGPTPWHVDARMAPFDTSHMITFWIPLQPVPKHGTALAFCSKSHADFSLPYWNPYQQTSHLPNSAWNRLEERYGKYVYGTNNNHALDPLCVDYMPMKLGDVTAHSGWTLHCSNPNLSQTEHRLALAITFVDAHAPVRNNAAAAFQNNNERHPQYMDSEDTQSYQDWLPDVPTDTRNWNHARVPIVWPPQKQKNKNNDRRSRH